MDLMVSVEIRGDGSKHVCEVQFVHKILLAVRKNMGGHEEYAVYRSAAELLEVHGGGAGGAGGEEKGVGGMVEEAKRSASVEFAL